MIAKRTPLALASIAALALAGLPAKAWAQHGGGRHGGGHHSGGHAVPRGGSPGHIPGGGGVAGARHPRAGTGTGGYYGYYGHGGRYGPDPYGYGGRYGHYRGYYGYYRPYGYASFFLGWPYYYSGWGPSAWVGSYDPGYYAPDPSYGMGYDARPAPPASRGRPLRRIPAPGRIRSRLPCCPSGQHRPPAARGEAGRRVGLRGRRVLGERARHEVANPARGGPRDRDRAARLCHGSPRG